MKETNLATQLRSLEILLIDNKLQLKLGTYGTQWRVILSESLIEPVPNTLEVVPSAILTL